MVLSIHELNKRSREIFREIVDTYIETGEPVGSRTLSRRLATNLSPATIRNVMADLEDAGLLYAPHTSAGRLPTEEGLRFFIHGLLEVGDLTQEDRQIIQERCQRKGVDIASVLEEATSALSGLTKCAGLVLAPKTDSALNHIEFVKLSNERVLVVLITEDGMVENRLIEVPLGITQSILRQATYYLNSRMAGLTLTEVKCLIFDELSQHKDDLDVLTTKIIEAGLAVWAGGKEGSSLIVKGQSNLLQDVSLEGELNRIRELFSALDTKETLVQLLDASIKAEGIQIFIGTENNLFRLSGCSMVVAPYRNAKQQILGTIGVIGPSRMNYGRIIPLVDYTAKVVGKLIG